MNYPSAATFNGKADIPKYIAVMSSVDIRAHPDPGIEVVKELSACAVRGKGPEYW